MEHEQDNELSVLQRPFQSQDLNLVEQLWVVIEQEIHSMNTRLKNLHGSNYGCFESLERFCLELVKCCSVSAQ